MDLYELFYLLGHGCHYLLCRYRRREKLCWACIIALSYKYNDGMKSSKLFHNLLSSSLAFYALRFMKWWFSYVTVKFCFGLLDSIKLKTLTCPRIIISNKFVDVLVGMLGIFYRVFQQCPLSTEPQQLKNYFKYKTGRDSSEDALTFSSLSWHVKLKSCPCSTLLSPDTPGWNGEFRTSLENTKGCIQKHKLGTFCVFGT